MAVPHITNAYPSQGHSGGTTMVRLLGGDFGTNVEVTFGGAVSENVIVINHALVYAETPISPLSDSDTGSGAGDVDIVLKNLDDNGDPIPGETYTLSNGFTYLLPKLYLSDMSRVVRQLIIEIKRQVLQNVIIKRGLDYAQDGSARVEFSALPGVTLIGPSILENRVWGTNVKPVIDGEYFKVRRRSPLTVDLQFTVVGGAERQDHQLSLLEAMLAFFHKNTTISVDRHPTDSAQGTISYWMDFIPGDLPAIVTAPNAAGVSVFTGTIGIIGVLVEGFSTIGDIPELEMVDEMVAPPPVSGVALTSEQIGEGAPPTDTSLPDQTIGARGIPGAYEPKRWRLK